MPHKKTQIISYPVLFVLYLADIFDKLQGWVVEWQVGTRQDGEHLRGLGHAPGARHLLLDLLSDGEEVLRQLGGHVLLGEGDHTCGTETEGVIKNTAPERRSISIQ